MTNKLLLIVFLLTPSILLGQDKEYNFINEIIKERRVSLLKKDVSYLPFKIPDNEIFTKFSPYIDSITLDSLIKQNRVLTVLDSSKISKIRLLSHVEYERALNDNCIVIVRKKLFFFKTREPLVKNPKPIFIFSSPIIYKQFAIIHIEQRTTPNDGSYCIYLYEYINGQWAVIAKSNCRVS